MRSPAAAYLHSHNSGDKMWQGPTRLSRTRKRAVSCPDINGEEKNRPETSYNKRTYWLGLRTDREPCDCDDL